MFMSLISVTGVSMGGIKVFLVASILVTTYADPSAVDVVQDIYKSCLQHFDVGCVKPKVLKWTNEALNKNSVALTEDLFLVKRYNPEVDERADLSKDIFDKFEDFLQSHDLVAKAPRLLRPDGPIGSYIPRNIRLTDVSVPLAATGRSSKLIKKVIFPFLLGLKLKTAVVVPIGLALIALTVWKAVTLGLLSLVLTGTIAIFTLFVGRKVPTYEVVHHPHVASHVDYHHVDVQPAVQYGYPVHVGRQLNAQNMVYNSYLNEI